MKDSKGKLPSERSLTNKSECTIPCKVSTRKTRSESSQSKDTKRTLPSKRSQTTVPNRKIPSDSYPSCSPNESCRTKDPKRKFPQAQLGSFQYSLRCFGVPGCRNTLGHNTSPFKCSFAHKSWKSIQSIRIVFPCIPFQIVKHNRFQGFDGASEPSFGCLAGEAAKALWSWSQACLATPLFIPQQNSPTQCAVQCCGILR